MTLTIWIVLGVTLALIILLAGTVTSRINETFDVPDHLEPRHFEERP